MRRLRSKTLWANLALWALSESSPQAKAFIAKHPVESINMFSALQACIVSLELWLKKRKSPDAVPPSPPPPAPPRN